jgi:hypothetical protein
MKTYQISFTAISNEFMEVQAESKDEAIEKMYDNYFGNYDEIEIFDVEEI